MEVKNFVKPTDCFKDNLLGYSHELLRRRALRFSREAWYLISSKLKAWKQTPPNPSEFDDLMARFDELSRFIEVNIEAVGRVDGAAENRNFALKELFNLVQSTIYQLQNPVNCSSAKFLIANINKGCGFGCQIHHVAHCLLIAYASKRTLLLKSVGWTYSKMGFESVFKPLSNCKLPKLTKNTPNWNEHGPFSSEKILLCPIVELLNSVPEFAHPAVPEDIATYLYRLHNAPHAWFSGNMIAYILRPADGKVSSTIAHTLLKIDSSALRMPVVGIHVRRTDKIGSEASYHHLREYMDQVKRYFDKIAVERMMSARTQEWQLDVLAKRPDSSNSSSSLSNFVVYLATDEPSLFAEARKLYPNYTFLGDESRAKTAQLSRRYSTSSLVAVIVDVMALSRTNYIVCTFSSQICRLAYELMQTRWEFGDASGLAQSLDDVYYYGGQRFWPLQVIIPDESAKLVENDLVTFHGNYWNGMAKVSAQHKNFALVPAFKVEQRLLSIKFGPSLNVSFLTRS